MSRERWPLPSDEAQFQAYMERLDRHCVDRDMPVEARQLAAIAEVCFDLGETHRVPRDREPAEGSYSGDDLLIRVIRWYDRTYGDALKIEAWLPPTLLYLRGELWQVRFPVITGTALFYASDPETGPAVIQAQTGFRSVPPGAAERTDSGLRRFDVLDFIVGLAPGARRLLPKGELPSILSVTCRNRVYAHLLVASRHHKYMEEALGDLTASVDLLMKKPPQTGPSKWASLQATEKALKSYLHHAGTDYPKSHDVNHLAELVKKAGGPSLTAELLGEVQCSPGVRYDLSAVDSGGARDPRVPAQGQARSPHQAGPVLQPLDG